MAKQKLFRELLFSMEKGLKFGKMESNIKEIGILVNNMGLERSLITWVTNMKEIGKMASNMDRVRSILAMDPSMMVIGKIIKCKVKVLL